MKIKLLGIAAPLLVLIYAQAAVAGSVTIDFEDGPSGAAIEDFYASSGVVFGAAGSFSPGGGTWFNLGFQVPGMSGTHWMYNQDGVTGFPTSSTPIVATFLDPVFKVSILAVDVGVNGARMVAYDENDNILGSSELVGVGLGAGEIEPLSVTAAGISWIELYQVSQASDRDSVAWDDLSFSTSTQNNNSVVAPLPSAAWVGFGLLGVLGLVRRRRRKAA